MKPASKSRSAVQLLYGSVSLLLLVLFTSASNASTAAESTLFSSDGYRIDRFRAPVPDSVPSGTTITTEQLHTLRQERDLLLIDVMPAPVKPKNRPDTLLWLPPSRDNIPGSYWLPNIGYGALSDELERYFKDNLERLSKGDKGREIVLYCLADCWMSWNAARRAATEYGYTNIYWYPDGTTGWEAAGLPLEQSAPIPLK
ncbi:MAG: PQQ-dependent catabolism-associated CXXCW motif protein [Candidatus Thiodiazotropha sp. (ex Ctena orbiculata)]|uniref:PQQ-dependent catabolism-associated CXXCW motif protein n=1 Tax=Candidatus Thiodiazotropha taylori TaxID=2792791 RepID=A0A944ME02_9GAMM|nr:PQQ-dependent catabolism-associated CXXCW motif protein [Candidatus Thiodiazotropha taylori]MBV2138837.1 PQQ-dependent catabolism-associated CXXCW motif protein [Candidatus Thiodiazotropha taylori]